MDENKIVAIISAPFLEEARNVNDAKWLQRHKEMLSRLIHSVIAQKQGEVVATLEGNTVIEIDIDNLDALSEIDKQFKIILDKDLLIGVGDTLEDAEKALARLEATNTHGIKVYQPDMEHEDEEPMEDETDELYPEQGLEASDLTQPNPKLVQESNDNDPKPALLNPSGAQQPPAQSQAPAAVAQDPSQAQSQPDLNQQAVPAPEAPGNPLPPELQQQLMQTLQSVQQNKPMLDKVKTEAPEIYQSVVNVVSSLVGIATDIKQGQVQPTIQTPDHSEDINNALMSSHEDEAKEKAKKADEGWKTHLDRTKKKRKMAKQDPELNLLMSLLKKD